ncbi:hypothetical protein JCM8097_003969 [Rhodosporidiobolus ruineniae]
MLDRLPPELVVRILRFVAPLDVGDWKTDNTASKRRTNLRRLCLVDKQLAALAQPMLPETFDFSQEVHIDSLAMVVGGRTRGSQVKVLKVTGERYYDDDEPEDQVRPNPQVALALCPNVVDLSMHDLPLVEMDWLAVIPALERLVISDNFDNFDAWSPTWLCTPSATSFSCLVELTITGVRPMDDFFSSVPSPSATPNLRALAVTPPLDDTQEGPPVLLPSLLSQLDILSLPRRKNKDEPRYPSPPALYDSVLGDVSPSDILCRPSIRLCYVLDEYGPDQPEVEMVKSLFALSSAISTASRRLGGDTKLHFLSISSYFTSSKRSNHNLKPAVQALVAIAEANDIEVAVESDEGFSPRFRQRTRRIREEQRREAEEEEYQEALAAMRAMDDWP